MPLETKQPPSDGGTLKPLGKSRSSSLSPRSFGGAPSVSLGRLSVVSGEDEGDVSDLHDSDLPPPLHSSQALWARRCWGPLRCLRYLLVPCAGLCTRCGYGDLPTPGANFADASVAGEASRLLGGEREVDEDADAFATAGTAAGASQRVGSATVNLQAGAVRRVYLPVRSRLSGGFAGAASTSLGQQVDNNSDNNSTADSALSSSTADGSRSALALARWGTRGKRERWVVQRGVLMCVGADGVAREASDTQSERLQWHDGRAGKTMQQPRIHVEDTDGGTADSPSFPPSATCGREACPCNENQHRDEDGDASLFALTAPRASQKASQNVRCVTVERDDVHRSQLDDAYGVVEELERMRGPIHTVAQLSAFLDHCAHSLPIRVEVTAEDDGHTSKGGYVLHVFGPLCPTAHAEVLSVVEDAILEDCIERTLFISSVHISDMTFSAPRYGSSSRGGGHEIADSVCLTAGAFAVGIHVSPDVDASTDYPGRQRSRSNAHLDMLPSLSEATGESNRADFLADASLQKGVSARDYESAADIKPSSEHGIAHSAHVAVSPVATRECQARCLAFLKNVVETQANTIQTIHLTRCRFTPFDLGKTLPLPLTPLTRLIFEQCTLTPAHIDALLQLSRAENRKNQRHRSLFSPFNSSADRDATALVALGSVRELQVSGTLTEDCVTELLNYFNDEVAAYGRPALQTLRVPMLLIRAAREHPFIETHPYVQVLPTR